VRAPTYRGISTDMLCDGQVVIVTGSGRGIGRAHALAFARQGAKVVVNDLGTDYTGGGRSSDPADQVVAEIKAMGGEAVANADDVTDPQAAARIVKCALDAFGDLHTVVNNAGFLRTKTIFDMTTEDLTASLGVHVVGAFNLTKSAAEYWRPRASDSDAFNASVINTSSAAGLWPSAVGDPNIPSKLTGYATAKAAVAAFTIAASLELHPLGIRVNSIAPGGRTRMNTDAIVDQGGEGVPPPPDEGFDLFDPSNVSPLVVWLSTLDAASISGRTFESGVGKVSVANGWTHGPEAFQLDRPWDPAELGKVVRSLLDEAPAPATMMGN
jgi:NAD(P)-dependent dehydrogenase (short-subunit alcohol dehydrogenase family)